MKVCDNGYSRYVILIGPYAIKMPYFRGSWLNFVRAVFGNLREAQIYRYMRIHRPEYLPLLCPVVCQVFGGLFLIMRRAETGLCQGDMHDHWQTFYDARLKGDDKCENYGRYNGRIVKLDYADCNHVFS